ncbi:uncharacterized protein LOC134472511 [Cavia porcellus]|uniref:uncharacterized protein LOC134472511 n=1 Tax=Cavia porcellus TaxID=10141 RepID=UPI002FE09190
MVKGSACGEDVDNLETPKRLLSYQASEHRTAPPAMRIGTHMGFRALGSSVTAPWASVASPSTSLGFDLLNTSVFRPLEKVSRSTVSLELKPGLHPVPAPAQACCHQDVQEALYTVPGENPWEHSGFVCWALRLGVPRRHTALSARAFGRHCWKPRQPLSFRRPVGPPDALYSGEKDIFTPKAPGHLWETCDLLSAPLLSHSWDLLLCACHYLQAPPPHKARPNPVPQSADPPGASGP